MQVYAELAEASLHRPREFSHDIVRLIAEDLDLQAASFYIAVPSNQTLRLKSQIGLSYDLYDDFQLKCDRRQRFRNRYCRPDQEAHREAQKESRKDRFPIRRQPSRALRRSEDARGIPRVCDPHLRGP
jgi:hypothetical protein